MTSNERAGFTIVEVLVAIVILAVGMLALATTSIYATTQVKVADLRVERSIAVQQVVEELRAVPFDSVTARTEANARTIGAFRVWWNVTSTNNFLKRVTVVTRGPGYRNRRGWVPALQDTTVVDFAERAID